MTRFIKGRFAFVMAMKTYTIDYPYPGPIKHPSLTVRETGSVKPYTDLPNGSLFLMDGCVFEKLDNLNAGCLLPWDDEGYYEMDSNGRLREQVQVLESVL